MRRVGVTAALLCFSWALGVRAEVRPDGGDLQLTLEAALTRAEARSPLVRRAASERRIADAGKVGAAATLPSNPVLSAAAGRRFDSSRSAPPADGLEWGLHLEQAFEIGGQRSARMAEAERAAEAARALYRLSLVETRANVRAAYVGALLLRAYVEAAKHREQLGAQVLSSAEQRVGAGAASDVDLHLAESEHGRATHDRIEAELHAGEAESELLRLLDFPPDTRVVLLSSIGTPGEPAPLDRLLGAARLRREELRALGAARQRTLMTLTRLRREIIPNPTLFADFASQEPGQKFIGGGVGLQLPLFRRNQGAIALAEAERARLDEESRILDREIMLEVVRMRRGLALRREEAQVWSERVVPAAEANLTLVTEGWKAGKFDLFRVVQVTREASDARRKQLEALGALWQAAIDLDRATGSP